MTTSQWILDSYFWKTNKSKQPQVNKSVCLHKWITEEKSDEKEWLSWQCLTQKEGHDEHNTMNHDEKADILIRGLFVILLKDWDVNLAAAQLLSYANGYVFSWRREEHSKKRRLNEIIKTDKGDLTNLQICLDSCRWSWWWLCWKRLPSKASCHDEEGEMKWPNKINRQEESLTQHFHNISLMSSSLN